MGWNQSNVKHSSKTRKGGAIASPSLVKGLIAGGVVVLVGILVVFLCLNSNKKPQTTDVVEKRSQKIEEVKPAAAPIVKGDESPQTANEDTERTRRREMFKTMTTEEKMAYLRERAQQRPLPAEPASNRAYRTSVEQVMDWVFTCEVGNPPPLLPKMSMRDSEHLAEILISDNPIKETDNERVKASKEIVMMAKKEFRDFIKQGGNPDDFLPYYHSQLVDAYEQRKVAYKSLLETVKNEPDIAVDYLKKVNEKLAEKGIKQLKIPPKLAERHGIVIDED